MVDLKKAEIAANRFHKTTILLASKVSGSPINSSHVYVTLPHIVTKGSKAICIYSRFKVHPAGLDDSDYINTYVVNGAFSLELHLKILMLIESGNWTHGHKLNELYTGLSDDSKHSIQHTVTNFVNKSEFHKGLPKAIKNIFGSEFTWNVDHLLENSSMAFEKYRYLFEGEACWFAGYAEIHFAIKERIKKIRDNKSLETNGDSVNVPSS